MLTLVQALDALMAGARQVSDVETIDTLVANGRVLAAPVTSALRVPPADNTAMDGYAVRAADVTAPGVRLPVSQRIPAGHVGTALAAGTAARIFTGGLIPPGADAVIMQEQCEADGDAVVIRHVPRAGEWVRRAGEDIEAGSVILPAGTRLTPQAVGLAASVGQATLDVTRRARVAVFFTGDELAMPGEPLKPGAIYNSNRYTLRGLLENLGCEVTDLGIVPDTLDATRDALRRAAAGNDVIITSGGVSVGEEDHVRPAVQAEGRLDLWQIAIKPGKPLAFGAVGETFFLGLPGNPVSSFVTFLLFVRPFLLRLQGVRDVAMRRLPLRADFDLPKGDRRNEFLRARLNAEGGLELFPNQSSGVLTSTVWGDGLIDNPPDHPIRRGDVVPFIPFQGLLD
ncbi:molybdopterin molybdotransferase MoeA [Cupriavidus plantarum]|uniref:molybdopterin molybdotransferase MoeA n=1 Tax=Cupriavidus plantarum TaxID=942865 RepID=UPI001B0D8667|nr:gephyrin-like molybdotransferase Glp [Cupriavidus plantarum]CAG2128135.1 Molybdopterin molybdenumtransferase [Cupriavidus plantarum]SMR66683.1 molybdopterin molybdotransferase [Cupriavidus plantarum]